MIVLLVPVVSGARQNPIPNFQTFCSSMVMFILAFQILLTAMLYVWVQVSLTCFALILTELVHEHSVNAIYHKLIYAKASEDLPACLPCRLSATELAG